MADVVEMYAVFREIIFGKDIFGIWLKKIYQKQKGSWKPPSGKT
jgi:hypothetical protein